MNVTRSPDSDARRRGTAPLRSRSPRLTTLAALGATANRGRRHRAVGARADRGAAARRRRPAHPPSGRSIRSCSTRGACSGPARRARRPDARGRHSPRRRRPRDRGREGDHHQPARAVIERHHGRDEADGRRRSAAARRSRSDRSDRGAARRAVRAAEAGDPSRRGPARLPRRARRYRHGRHRASAPARAPSARRPTSRIARRSSAA